MPLPLIAASVEHVLNSYCYCSPALNTARQRLNGKVLCVSLTEFQQATLSIFFRERQVNVLGTWEEQADCFVIMHLSSLSKLCDRQQLIDLIYSDALALKVEGDMQVVRNFITLLDLAEFDLAELLVPYMGDIVAEGFSKILRRGTALFRKGMQRQQRYAAEVLIEEWRIAPGPLEVAWFAEETAVIELAVDALAKRMAKLEGK